MQEATKDDLRRHIEKLKHALYVAESRREQAERRLKEIEGVLSSAASQNPDVNADYSGTYYAVIQRAMDAIEVKAMAGHEAVGRVRGRSEIEAASWLVVFTETFLSPSLWP
jgi:hypothetical protein